MKRNLLITVSALALTAAVSGANAQPVYSWQGFYVGINGGAAWHRAAIDFNVGSTVPTAFTTTGGTFGGQIGANWQSQMLVYGIEADLNWVGATGTTGTPGPGEPFTSKLSWVATVRGRAGILIAPPTLLYLTGGLAFGQVENTLSAGTLFTESATRTGWAIGGGLEHIFSPMWTVKAEVLYIDLGGATVGPVGYVNRFTNQAWLGRVGLNLKW